MRAGGSKAVLEVRSHGVAITLEHGQVVGWRRSSEIGMGVPNWVYGKDTNLATAPDRIKVDPRRFRVELYRGCTKSDCWNM